jgi:hypothetical protein
MLLKTEGTISVIALAYTSTMTIGVTLLGSRGWHRPKLRRKENYVACSAC